MAKPIGPSHNLTTQMKKNIDKKQALANMRLFATSLLLLVAALYILARSRHGHHAWDWVAAFAEAAMIGALADWFAVVALFKHPLGLPIPHTAIIPRNKERIADNLAAFVRDKFLDTEVLVEKKVREFNPTLKIAAWLTRGANAALLADKLVAVFLSARSISSMICRCASCCAAPWRNVCSSLTSASWLVVCSIR
ncbi:DUF445 family protein [Undibacterium arcticum]